MINEAYKPKKFGQHNDVIPHIIKGFLSDDEVKEIKELIEHGKSLVPGGFYSPLVLPKLAREQIELKISGKLLKKIEDFASDFVGEDVKMTHNSYLSYNAKHSEDSSITPNLPPHFDSDNYFTKLTIDYQLDSNISWPVVIDVNGELYSFDMEYGDLLVFWGAGTIHWRDPIILKKGDNCEVWTAHFAVQKDFDELNGPARNPEARKLRMKEWEEKSKYKEHHNEWQAKLDLLQNKNKGFLKIEELNKKLENSRNGKIVERNNNV